MANTEFTTASLSDVPPAHVALQNGPQADAPIAPEFADAQFSQPEDAPPPVFKPRQMKISYLPLTREAVPFLRLRGKWLAQAGFEIGSDVRISVAPQRLVIETKSPEGKTKSQIRDERRAALKAKAARNDVTTAASVYPSLGDVEMIHDATPIPSRTARHCQPHAMASTPSTRDAPRRGARRKVPSVCEGSGTWPERISATLKPALGDVLHQERSDLDVSPVTIATHAQVSGSSYRAFDRGDRQPNLATFIAIAWTLDLDPRELFDKLLLQMGLPPGTRPVISARLRRF